MPRICVCKVCGEEKEHKARGMCHLCYGRVSAKEYRAKNLEKIREKDRKRWPKRRKEQNKKRNQRYYANYEEERARQEEYRKNNIEKIRKQQREYNRSPRGKAIRKAYATSDRARKLNRAKMRRFRKEYRARRFVKWSVEKGDLPHVSTLSCILCGEQGEHYHHYNGYDKQHRLDVVPVCARCHPTADKMTVVEIETAIQDNAPFASA